MSMTDSERHLLIDSLKRTLSELESGAPLPSVIFEHYERAPISQPGLDSALSDHRDAIYGTPFSLKLADRYTANNDPADLRICAILPVLKGYLPDVASISDGYESPCYDSDE